MANFLPSSSSLNEVPLSSLEKFACIFVQDEERLEWYAFDVSDDPKVIRTLPLSVSRCANHHLFAFHEEEKDESGYLKPIATASSIDLKWYDMWAILDDYLYRIYGGNKPTRQVGANLVERICIKDISPDSASKWEHVDPTPILVAGAHVLVMGGKLYCLGSVHEYKSGPWAVAYVPDKAEWQSVPNPQNLPKSNRTIFSASMEKSTLVQGPCIIVGSPDDGVLQIYNPETQDWVTDTFDIKGGRLDLYDLVGNAGHPLAVDNKLYWYSVQRMEIFAYDLSTKVWSMGHLPIHDDEDYFSDHALLPPSLAHLGSDKFCLFWVSVFSAHNDNFKLPEREDFITRLHCLKFQVTAFAGNLRPLGRLHHVVPISLGFRSQGFPWWPWADSFEIFEAPGSTVIMQEEMVVEVPGMKRNLEEYSGGSEPSSSKRYSSAPSHEEVQVLKNEVETLKDLCRRQAEQLENKSQLIDDQAKKIEELKAFYLQSRG